MFNLTKGYKQGRAVMFYDLTPVDGSCAREMVSKDEVVQLCTDGKISNAKIQWWEGKAIIRCDNKQLPLVRVDEKGNIIGVATQAVRGKDKEHVSVCVTDTRVSEPTVSVADKAVEVGKLSSRKPKRNISYSGYDKSYVIEKQELHSSIDISGLRTVSDLFDYIAKDFRVQQVDKYKAEFGKKVNLDKELADINQSQLRAIQYGAATYLMNMLYDEIAEVYMKW